MDVLELDTSRITHDGREKGEAGVVAVRLRKGRREGGREGGEKKTADGMAWNQDLLLHDKGENPSTFAKTYLLPPSLLTSIPSVMKSTQPNDMKTG